MGASGVQPRAGLVCRAVLGAHTPPECMAWDGRRVASEDLPHMVRDVWGQEIEGACKCQAVPDVLDGQPGSACTPSDDTLATLVAALGAVFRTVAPEHQAAAHRQAVQWGVPTPRIAEAVIWANERLARNQAALAADPHLREWVEGGGVERNSKDLRARLGLG